MLYFFLSALCPLIWAGVIITTKLLTEQMPALPFSFIRYSLVAGALLPFFMYCKEYQQLKVQRIPGLLLLGFLLVVVHNSLFFTALHYTSATSVALITATSHVYMLALAALFGQTNLTRLHILAILLCLIGTACIVTQGRLFFYRWEDYIGELLAIGAVFSQILYSHALRKINMRNTTLFDIFATAFAGVICAVPLMAHTNVTDSIVNLSSAQWALFAFISLVGSVLSIFLYTAVLKHQGIVQTNMLTFTLLPLFTAVSAHLILGESIEMWQIEGGVLIACSLLLSCTTRKESFFSIVPFS